MKTKYLIQQIENYQIKKNLPKIEVGDLAKIGIIIQEGNKQRVQPFEGTVIAKIFFKEFQLNAYFYCIHHQFKILKLFEIQKCVAQNYFIYVIVLVKMDVWYNVLQKQAIHFKKIVMFFSLNSLFVSVIKQLNLKRKNYINIVFTFL